MKAIDETEMLLKEPKFQHLQVGNSRIDLEESDDDYGDISHLMSSGSAASSFSDFDSVRCDWFVSST